MNSPEHPSAEEAEEAAREIGSSDRLLPGEKESEASAHLEDAVHWMRVYEELFGFKQNLLAVLVEQRDSVDPDGLDEVENDEIVLTREADRLSSRLEFWRGEVAKRSGPDRR
jgi:hypothetical protein